MRTNKRALVVDDDSEMVAMLVEVLERRGFSVVPHTDPEAALQDLRERDVDVVLTDLNMPRVSGVALCERIVANRPDIPVVVLTAFGSLETAVAAIRAGAYDFVTKPCDMDLVVLALDRAVEHRRLREEVRKLRNAVGGLGDVPLIGESAVMQRLRQTTAQIAAADSPVVIEGESGTGKEVVARTLHALGGAERPFVAVNCSAVPESLLESELFGHMRGAFTDARESRVGLFKQADGGVLFLDEVGELPASVQPKLLRALQERRVRPVGADTEQPFSARLIAATNRDLEAAVEAGTFRRDLFYRLCVVVLHVPPLRARGDDVLTLGQHFLHTAAARTQKDVVGFTPAVAERLLAYRWPGNVRELHNAIEHAVLFATREQIGIDDLPERVRAAAPSAHVSASGPEGLLPMHEVERRYILRVLDEVGGNRSMAARLLGFDRRTIQRKLAAYGLAGD